MAARSVSSPGGGGGLLLGLNVLRLAAAAPLAVVTTALVWLLCHELGYLRSPCAEPGSAQTSRLRRHVAAVAAAGGQ